MDYFYFILIIFALLFIIYFLNRIERRTKAKLKKTAYGLLEIDRPDPKEMKDIIKGLRLYGGRWFKDKECVQLVDRLVVKYNSLEK